MKKQASNWHFYQYFFHFLFPAKFRKKRFGYYFFTLILTALGSLLLLSMLNMQDLRTSKPTSPVSFEQRLANSFTPSVSNWSKEILDWSDEWDLDPLLIATVMQIESCGNPTVVSPAGAQGLFQVMPYHFYEDENTLDPEVNARRGLAYLHQAQILSEGNIEGTLAGYNGGHGQIGKQPKNWPEETQRYVHWGSGIYYDALANENQSKILSAWLDAGGWRLCQDAENHLDLR